MSKTDKNLFWRFWRAGEWKKKIEKEKRIYVYIHIYMFISTYIWCTKKYTSGEGRGGTEIRRKVTILKQEVKEKKKAPRMWLLIKAPNGEEQPTVLHKNIPDRGNCRGKTPGTVAHPAWGMAEKDERKGDGDRSKGEGRQDRGRRQTGLRGKAGRADIKSRSLYAVAKTLSFNWPERGYNEQNLRWLK